MYTQDNGAAPTIGITIALTPEGEVAWVDLPKVGLVNFPNEKPGENNLLDGTLTAEEFEFVEVVTITLLKVRNKKTQLAELCWPTGGGGFRW